MVVACCRPRLWGDGGSWMHLILTRMAPMAIWITHLDFCLVVWGLLYIGMPMFMLVIPCSFVIGHWAIPIANSPASRHPTHTDLAWCAIALHILCLSMSLRTLGHLIVAMLPELATNSRTCTSRIMVDANFPSFDIILAAMDPADMVHMIFCIDGKRVRTRRRIG